LIRFINPNYHVILIHYPLALLGLGLVIEIFSFLWRNSSVRVAGQWMLLLGALAMIPAATSGIFAKQDILSQLANGQGNGWQDIKSAAKLSGAQWSLLNRHVLWASIAAALAALGAIIWLGGSVQWPSRPGVLPMGLFFAAMLLTGFAAYNAGEIVYRTGFATRGETASDKLQTDWQAQTDAAKPSDRFQRRIEYYVDTLQIHVIAAGLVFALAAAAWGLSFRRSAQLKSKQPANDAPLAPAPRFWFLTALAGAATLSVGWYVIAHDLDTPLWNLRAAFTSEILQPYQKDAANNSRMMMHLILGAGIVALALILIPAAYWGRSRLLVGFLGLLLLVVIAAQIWIGTVMLFDGDSGPLRSFNPATASVAQTSASSAAPN
jgi:hypothetical protein